MGCALIMAGMEGFSESTKYFHAHPPVKPLRPLRSGQGASCYSHFTDEEDQLRSERFSGVGLNILNIRGHLLGHWKSDCVQEPQWWLEINPLLGCGCLGVSSCAPPFLCLFIAHSVGEMFLGPCLLEFCIFSLFTPAPASLELGFSWKGCLWEWAFVWISLSLEG